MKKHLIPLCFLVICIMILSSCENALTNETGEDSISSPVPESSSLRGDEYIFETTVAPLIIENSSYNFWLPCEYDYFYRLSSGVGLFKKDGMYSLIYDDKSMIFSTFEYEVINSYKNMVCIQSTENNLYGLMYRDGNIIIEPQYDSPLEFTEDLAAVIHNGKLGYINTGGELVIDCFYEWGGPFSEGLAAVGIGEQFWFIDIKGEVISGPYEFTNMDTFSVTVAYMAYSEGYTAYFEKNEEGTAAFGGGGYWGYLDKGGNVAIPAQYSFVRPFKGGLAAVETKDGQWIYIDKNGRKVMDGTPSDFSDGLACTGKEFIDKSGNTVVKIPEKYQIETSAQQGIDNFRDGLIVLFRHENMRSIYSVMDINGEIVLESADFEEVKIFKEKLVAVKINGKWGVIHIPEKN